MVNYIIKIKEDVDNLINILGKIKFDKPRKITIETYDQRTAEQNKQQWPYLDAFSKQITYHGRKLDKEDWKDILTASYRGEMIDMMPTLDGKRMVCLGLRTSKMDAEEWPNWIAYLKWAAAEYGVNVPLSKKQINQYLNYV